MVRLCLESAASGTPTCEKLEKAVAANYDHPVNEAQRIHRQKVLRRVRDLKAQARGRKLPKGFCLAKCVDRDVFKSPLDLKGVVIPATYED
jgi:hypothetical protein